MRQQTNPTTPHIIRTEELIRTQSKAPSSKALLEDGRDRGVLVRCSPFPSAVVAFRDRKLLGHRDAVQLALGT